MICHRCDCQCEEIVRTMGLVFCSDFCAKEHRSDAHSAQCDAEIDDEHEGIYRDDNDRYDDSMDGDHASGLASAGWGTDEDYGGGMEDQWLDGSYEE